MSQSSASVVESSKSEPRKEEAPPGEQRDGLRSLLRGLSFAQQEQALKPGGESAPGAPPRAPRAPKDKVTRLLTLVPLALEGVGDTETEARPKAPGQQPPARDESAERESQEAEQAEQLLDESDAPDDPPEQVEVEPESETAEAELDEVPGLLDAPELAEPELTPEPIVAPVQMKAKPGARPAPKAAPKPAASKAVPKPAAPKAAPRPIAKPAAKKAAPKAAPKLAKAGPKSPVPKARSQSLTSKQAKARTTPTPAPSQGTTLDAAACRAAYRWTMRQGFASVPFIVRRYQRFLNMPANGNIEGNWKFVQAIAAFQVRHGIKKVDGKLAGATAKKMRELLQKRCGLDDKSLLTQREVGMAQKKNVAAIRDKKHPLSWGVVRELRKLLDMKPEGGLNGPFLRKVAEFQRQHDIGYSAQITKNTINTMREELGDTWHHPLPGGRLTSPFGMRKHPKYGDMRMHYGVDLAGPTKIVAARAGKVKAVLTDPPGFGNYLILSHKDCDTLYAHCSAIHVKAGQQVKAGEKIATAGETGGSVGVHLHFEVHKPRYKAPVDPQKFI